jgi:hypothetical protein
MHACVTSINLVRALPPTFVPNIMAVDKVVGVGRRKRSHASLKRGHSKSMWSTVCNRVRAHGQLCGSGAHSLCLALYLPVKACSVSILKVVQKIGLAELSMPVVNSRGCPEGRWWRAWYAGFLCRSFSQIFSHSVSALSFALCQRAVMVGGGCCLDRSIMAAALEVTSSMCLRGRKLVEPGIQLMVTIIPG